MNSFEEYTVIIGLLAVAIEGFGILAKRIRNLFHH